MASDMASFSISRNGFAPVFLGTVFFCFFALGGVVESTESSCNKGSSESLSSSSVSTFFLFFGTAFGFNVVCVVFLDGSLGPRLVPGLGPRFAPVTGFSVFEGLVAFAGFDLVAFGYRFDVRGG